MSYCVVCVVLYVYGSFPTVVCSVGGLMSYCVVCVVLYLYGSLPSVVCSVGGFMSYCVVCVVFYLYGSLPPVVCSVGGLVVLCYLCFVVLVRIFTNNYTTNVLPHSMTTLEASTPTNTYLSHYSLLLSHGLENHIPGAGIQSITHCNWFEIALCCIFIFSTLRPIVWLIWCSTPMG